MRPRGSRFVDVEGLRVETRREGFDLVAREGVAADRSALADGDVLEIFHGRPPASRRRIINGLVSVVSTVPCSSSNSNRHLTNPISGRLLDARVSSTVVRTRTRVSGLSGFSQRTSSTPGAPM